LFTNKKYEIFVEIFKAADFSSGQRDHACLGYGNTKMTIAAGLSYAQQQTTICIGCMYLHAALGVH
jgi:hypothetical protein